MSIRLHIHFLVKFSMLKITDEIIICFRYLRICEFSNFVRILPKKKKEIMIVIFSTCYFTSLKFLFHLHYKMW